MKQKKIVLLAVIIVLIIASYSGCLEKKKNGNGTNPGTQEIVITNGLNDYVNESNSFCFDIYDELSNEEENLFFSPYSIFTALAMAYEGARGDTAEEMENVMGFPEDDQDRREMVLALQNILNEKNSDFNLSAANSYWLRQGEELIEEYQNIIETYYLAYGEQLDFINDPEGSAETINNWVENETNDKIKDILSSSDITPSTYLILANAIYFKSDWRYKFNPDSTYDEEFTLSSGDTSSTEMMYKNNEKIDFNYSSNSEVKLLQLPYKNKEYSMYILLPKDNDITSVESKLDQSYFANLKNNMNEEYVKIYLPKFKFEFKEELSKTLKNMGMSKPFSNADFSGIINSTVSLSISKVIHQSFIEVAENGTEAAAATVVCMDGEAAPPQDKPEPIIFKADHPFIYLIQSEESGQILFMGKVENPNEES